MSTASPLPNRQTLRQNGPVSTPRAGRSDHVPVPARTSRMAPLSASIAADDEFRIDLSDLPRANPGLHVDGFQPSLASRVLDLIDRLRNR
jgi:hypothetical protein